MQEDNYNHNDINEYNLDTLQDSLFNRLKNLYLEDDEPYFMINYKPQPHGKCFLTTDDINKHVHNGCLIFPKTFCKRLRGLAEPIQNDQQQMEEIVDSFVERMKEELINEVNHFGETIKNQLIPNAESYEFFKKFHKGNYKDDEKLLQELERMIKKWEEHETNIALSSINDILQQISNEFNKLMKEVKALQENLINVLQKTKLYYRKSDGKKLEFNQVKDYSMPKSFELIDQVEINKGKSIPETNGIDIHPNRNVYIGMSCSDGDLVIRDQSTNKQISRVKLKNNFNGSFQLKSQNCLWSPSGDKIMVSTMKNHSIYIYDEAGQKLLKSIEKTYHLDGYGAIWLSEQEVAVGYTDGMVKFFNVNEGKEIGNIKVNGTNAWGMDCVNDSYLLVGDNSGSITNIDWRNLKTEWTKIGWHSNSKNITCLRVNQHETKLLTGSEDYYVKLMKLQDQSRLWEFKVNHCVQGISWVPGELYVLAISYKNQLVALNSNDGTKMMEFNELSPNLMSLRVNPRTAEVLIGDANGTIRRLKICQDQSKQSQMYRIFIVSQ